MLADPRAADALVDDFAAQWLNLRRLSEVVVDPDLYPELRRQPARGVPAGNGAVRRQHAPRGSERAGSPDARTTRSSTSAWRGTTAFRASTAAASGASRCPTPTSAAGCSRTARCSRRRRIRTAHRRCCAANGCWTTSSGLTCRRRRRASIPTCRKSSPGTVPPTIRERLAQHRKNPICSSCHAAIDPLGFALENFDAIGGWRTVDESGKPVDASGTTAERPKVEGLAGLRALLLEQPDQFPRTLTEKLMAYALGRRLDTTIGRRCGRSCATRRRRLPLVVDHSRESSRAPRF